MNNRQSTMVNSSDKAECLSDSRGETDTGFAVADSDARCATLEYFDGDTLSTDVWLTKYALRDRSGRLLEKTPADMHRRLAREFARIEKKYANPMSEDEIFSLLSDWSVVPQGSPMSGIGNDYQIQSLSNCFVIDSCYDSYSGILKTDQELVQIMKRRGGVGFDISTIRPKGMRTSNAAGSTDGIGVFMERFSRSTREVAQGGRRGALLMSISIQHPQIETFINIKHDKTKVTGANISIRLSDDFMRAVKNDSDFVLQWPTDVPLSGAKLTRTVKARDIWNKITENAWENAEPGLLFWDTIKRETPADIFADKGFASKSTNPCGEIVLSPHDACRLMLLNLLNYIEDAFKDTGRFDYESFSRDARKAQRLMDDLVDLEIEALDKIIKKIESDPEPISIKQTELELWKKIRHSSIEGRRTGLGITALGDAIASLNMEYGSDESIEFTESVYRTLAIASHTESVQLATERGAFPACEAKRYRVHHPFIARLNNVCDSETIEKFLKHGRRNICLTTTAPAGSVSILTKTSSGCEPVFMNVYKRRRKNMSQTDRCDFVDDVGDKWQEYTVFHPGVERWMKATGKTADQLEESPYWRSTSEDIDWTQRIKLQAVAQKWIEHSISSTVNLPASATVDDVKRVYELAWRLGCKGVTVYRAGSRSGVLVSSDEKREQGLVETDAPKRPKELRCDIHRASVQGLTYLVIVGLMNGKPYEVFAGRSEFIDVPKKFKNGFLIKNGKNADGLSTYTLRIPIGDDDALQFKDVVNLFDSSIYGAFTRTISLALRHGVPLKFLCEQLKKDKNSDITSFSSVIARVLSKNYISDGTVAKNEKSCPQCCSETLVYQDGCVRCTCGWSKC